MQKPVYLFLVAALIGAGVWAWRLLFPSPEHVIRSTLDELARTVSVLPTEGVLARGYKLEKLPDFFTPDVIVHADLRGMESQSFNGRDELMAAGTPALQSLHGLKVEFLDINVTFGPDRKTAVANLTCKATVTNEHDFYVQEFNFMLRKIGRRWLIYRIDTVKTLSLEARRLAAA
jgi:hypothetical protein